MDPERDSVSKQHWLNTTKAAEYVGCHPETLREAARLRELAHSRRGPRGHLRFTTDDLDRWLGRQWTPPQKAGDLEAAGSIPAGSVGEAPTQERIDSENALQRIRWALDDLLRYDLDDCDKRVDATPEATASAVEFLCVKLVQKIKAVPTNPNRAKRWLSGLVRP